MLTIDEELASRHYAEHVGKPFYPDLVAFIGRSPAVAMIIEGPEDTWAIVRKMMGATNSAEAEPGTIRGDLSARSSPRIWCTAPTRAESAVREIGIFFRLTFRRAGPARLTHSDCLSHVVS